MRYTSDLAGHRSALIFQMPLLIIMILLTAVIYSAAHLFHPKDLQVCAACAVLCSALIMWSVPSFALSFVRKATAEVRPLMLFFNVPANVLSLVSFPCSPAHFIAVIIVTVITIII